MRTTTISLFVSILLVQFCCAQTPITLYNPSFEIEEFNNDPKSSYPDGWIADQDHFNPIDVRPYLYDADSEKLSAAGISEIPIPDGKNFTILITTENRHIQSLGQELPQPLQKDHTYLITVSLAFLPQLYGHRSMNDSYEGIITDFSHPIKLRIAGSTSLACGKRKLAESIPIAHHAWKTYSFTFTPKRDYTHLWLQSQHDKTYKHYDGHLLIDGVILSELEPSVTLEKSCIISREKSLQFEYDPEVTLENFKSSWHKNLETSKDSDENNIAILDYYNQGRSYGIYRYVRDLAPEKLNQLLLLLKAQQLSVSHLEDAATLSDAISLKGLDDESYQLSKKYDSYSEWQGEVKAYLKQEALLED